MQDTRPSTPPPYTFPTTHSSLSSHPYLQQLEEAISTPVPDLASTLTTPESRPRTARRSTHPHGASAFSNDAAATINHLLRDHSPSPSSSSERQSPGLIPPLQLDHEPLSLDEHEQRLLEQRRDAYREQSEAQLQVVQGEVERWQNERERLRGILQSQEERQSVLEGENWRLREQRRRLRGERRRLWEGGSGSASGEGRMEEGMNPHRGAGARRGSFGSHYDRHLRTAEETSWQTTTETRRRERFGEARSYVSRMSGEAATWGDTRESMRPPTGLIESAPGLASQEHDEHEGGLPPPADGELDSGPRRELDRALRNYRAARNAMRANRHPVTDLGTVPTASALRAYWSEEPEQVPQLPSPQAAVHGDRTPFSLSEFVSQHREDRQRRAQQSEWRQQHMAWRERMQRNNQEYSERRETMRHERTPEAVDASEAFARVRNTIQYLSDLRTISVQQSFEAARALSLDTLYEYADTSTASDLPMTVDALPQPQPSSWLKAGMTWQGLQSTDREPYRPTLLASTLRRMRQREYASRSMARRGYTNEPYNQHSYRSLQPIPPEETDRYLNYFMDNPSSRWAQNDAEQQLDAPTSGVGVPGLENLSLGGSGSASADTDHWPVTVTLHEVNWNNMTISGTMRASQIPDRTHENQEGKSMESYFQGEIIDFRHHTLLSDGQQLGYNVGEVDVDARYWARLGPFKQEIERATSSLVQARKWDGKTKWGATATQGVELRQETLNDGLGEGRRRDEVAEEVMARRLGSAKWLREVGGEWVLMRWKGEFLSIRGGKKCLLTCGAEKCFVDPIITPPSSSTPSSSSSSSSPPTTIPPTTITTSEYPTTSTTLLGDRAQAQWGLTISGFYYVALHRQSGRIDGLYYDPGSQPYQSLRMAPEGCMLEREDGAVGERGVERRREREREDLGVGAGVGVKKCFPAVELR